MEAVKKYGWMVLAVIWSVLVIWKGITPGWQDGRTDFSNYYASAKLLSEGQNIASFYDNESFFADAQNVGVKHGAKFAPFTPFTAYCLVPITPFSEIAAKRIWLVINVLILLLAIYFLHQSLKLPTYLLIALAFILFTPLASNLRLGQIYLAISVALLAMVRYLNYKNWLFEGLIALFALLKIFPAFFLIYRYAEQRSFKPLLWFGLVSLGLILGVIAHQGIEPFVTYISVFGNHINGSLSGQEIHSFYYQSIDSLLHYFFEFDPTFNPAPLLDAPILKSIFKWIFVLGILILTVTTLVKPTAQPDYFKESTALLGLTLLFPATATYHFLLLLTPLVFLISSVWKKGNFKTTALVVLVAFLALNISPNHLPNLTSLPNLNALIHYPRLFGLIALFLIFYRQTLKTTNG